GIFTFERKRWRCPLKWHEMVGSVKEMRRHRFDLVIDLQGLARSGTFAWLANGGTLVGVDDPREGAGGYYDIAVSRPSYQTHAVDWYLQVLERLKVPVDRPFVWLPVNDYAQAIVKEQQGGRNRYILLNPGARWVNKRWPAEYFALLAQKIAATYPEITIVITGAKNEAYLGEQIKAAVPDRCLDLTGKTSLVEMVEWIRGGLLMVTNDTGPMHIAAAVGTPVISLFGPTDADRTGPYGQSHNAIRVSLPCAPCMKDRCENPNYLECLTRISPERVLEEIHSRLH
ncbi:MAG: glycosyltransferase family 9 protein, partial [Limisphaerales bacterium]